MAGVVAGKRAQKSRCMDRMMEMKNRVDAVDFLAPDPPLIVIASRTGCIPTKFLSSFGSSRVDVSVVATLTNTTLERSCNIEEYKGR